MVISASRRTDIPAFYAPWFMNRVRAGSCIVPNPVRPAQRARVSLRRSDVDAIVFWTRDPRPLVPYLGELHDRGYPFYFLFTLMDNPAALDPGMPPLSARLDAFRDLAARLGPGRVVWRYDPIVLTGRTDVEFHVGAFRRLARELRGATLRCIVSLLDLYPKVRRRLHDVESQGFRVEPADGSRLARLVPALAATARDAGMEIQSCAEDHELRPFGVAPGKCIDDVLLRRVLGVEVGPAKDPGQRPLCACIASRDVGMYDTCVFGCRYCYANSDPETARLRRRQHDPLAEPLLAADGDHSATP